MVEMTKTNMDRSMALLVADEVIMTPRIRAEISEVVVIEASFGPRDIQWILSELEEPADAGTAEPTQ
jgi:preprotein translocase subunit SecD